MANHPALILAANMSLYAILVFVHTRAARDPGERWVYWLFVRQFGPRTDTERMRLMDCFRSAFASFLWFVAFAGLWLLNAYTSQPFAEASALRLTLNFMSGLFALLWVAVAGWVCVRGLLALIRQVS